jgi:hypothetical protein
MDQERFGLSFDAAIHTGTVLAVVWYFWANLPVTYRGQGDHGPCTARRRSSIPRTPCTPTHPRWRLLQISAQTSKPQSLAALCNRG